MPYTQVSLRLDSGLLVELDNIAGGEFKRRSDVIRDALVEYVKHQIEIRNIKEMVTKQYLDGKLSFDDFARVVGFDTARDIKTAKETLEESIIRAKKDSKQKK